MLMNCKSRDILPAFFLIFSKNQGSINFSINWPIFGSNSLKLPYTGFAFLGPEPYISTRLKRVLNFLL